MVNELLGNRKYFKLLFIVYVFTNTLALGYFGITFNPLCILVGIYGLVILLYGLLKGEIFYSKNHLLVILLYGCLLAIATFLNKTYSSINSYVITSMQLLIFVLLFAQPKSMSLKQLKKELRLIISMTSLLVGMASLISLFMYFGNISGQQNGWYIGLVGNRLFGVYFNCNPASFLAVIVIILSFIAIKSHYPMKMLYYVNICIQFMYVILTQCRASVIILAVIMTAILYYHFFRSHEMSSLKRLSISFVICISVLFGSVIVNKVAFIIPQLQGAVIKEESRFQFDKIHEVITLTLSGELQNIPKIVKIVDEVSSGRITLARESIDIFRSSPINGIGAGNYRDMLVSITNNPSLGQQILHTHNVFMETLVTAGIFGFLLFFIFFIKTLFTTRDIFIKYRNKKSYLMILLFVMVYVSEFIGGFFDFGVFYVYSLSASLAWIFLGYIYWLNDQPDFSLIDDTSVATFNKYQLISIKYHKEIIDTIKPEFSILDIRKEDDYILTVEYYLGRSSFVYDLYYSLYLQESDELNNELAREFYSLVKDDIEKIYSQSQIQ